MISWPMIHDCGADLEDWEPRPSPEPVNQPAIEFREPLPKFSMERFQDFLHTLPPEEIERRGLVEGIGGFYIPKPLKIFA